MRKRWPLMAGLWALTVALTSTVALASVSSGSYATMVPMVTPANSVGLEVRPIGVDPSSGVMRLLLVPTATGDFGQSLAHGAFFTAPLIFNADVSSGQSTVTVPASSVVGGLPAEILLDGTEVNYTFDSYTTALFASVSSNATTAEGSTPEFVLSDGGSLVPGYDLQSSAVSFLTDGSDEAALAKDRQAGFGYMAWNVGRSSATKFIAILIAVLMIMGALVSILITWAIVRGRRPSSINALVWLAAFLFAMFQVRQTLPGNPAPGITFDRLVFFPVVLTLVLLIVVNLIAWSTRNDWDMENPIFAIRGQRHRDPGPRAEG